MDYDFHYKMENKRLKVKKYEECIEGKPFFIKCHRNE